MREGGPLNNTGTITPQPPEVGQLVTVRDRRWIVSDVNRSSQAPDALGAAATNGAQHLITLASIEDDAMGEDLQVVWELEPGRSVIDHAALPDPDPDRFDDPERLDAFLDAVRWGAIASADSRTLQAPFRSGIAIEDYQLDPVVRGLRMPRVNLLIADDVGLGKTIEAGLVVQELLLRHRARTVLVVCPASLTIKWRDEMAEKFGLEFRIVDAELLRHLRRTRGLQANPWTHFPRLIVSIDWLKRDRPMRFMHDVIHGAPPYPRRFDLLIVDEAHGIAPSGRGRYAVDSLRTRAVRAIVPHFEHRLFLTATPHNGYLESFTALLELLDNQRFARGVRPGEEQLGRAMIRRLKEELRKELPPKPDGSPRFPQRVIDALEVPHTDQERAIHAKLAEYGRLRIRAAGKDDGSARVAADFVVTLLKKRLFSSPAGFAVTLETHRETLRGRGRGLGSQPSSRILRRLFDDAGAEFSEEHEQDDATRDALGAAAEVVPSLTERERQLLDAMTEWARSAKGRGDSKANVLLKWLEEIVHPEGASGKRAWTDERVIIFTEYRDTQRWLQERLVAQGLGGERLALLYGGMDAKERERIKSEFQAAPDLSPIRILLATDSASEGIDLQRQCYRLVHYEIPWNPNRLEQRNGRIDRHGQPSPEVLIYHFVGSGFEDAATGSLEGDLQFLYIAAKKVEQIRDDLGSVGPVIAEQVEEAMLGQRQKLDTTSAEKRAVSKKALKLERDLRAEVARLRERLDESVSELRITPQNVDRVVRVALDLARQPQLKEAKLNRPSSDKAPRGPVFELPQLTGSWARAAEGLHHPVTGEVRPVTFDHGVAADHDDVVLVHLQHRLVQQSLRLLRSEIWSSGGASRLSRVTVRVAPRILDHPAVVAHGRLVITGSDGHRLHEEVIAAGGILQDGRFGRLGVTEIDRLLSSAAGIAPDTDAYRAMAEGWPRLKDPLLISLEKRGRDRAESLMRSLSERADQEVDAITKVLTDLNAAIEAELAEAPHEQLRLELSTDERDQLTRDVDALKRRLERIPDDIQAETLAITRRYERPEPRFFPTAVTFLIPEGWKAQ
jgi:SNF2 family DNA or RNA helicase